MHAIERPNTEPAQLSDLRQEGGENFGALGPILDQIFGRVCAYCERQPLWYAQAADLGLQDTDLPDEPHRLFTCDHFRPRHLLCSRQPQVGQCANNPPPHSPDCSIYDWHNLVYACQPCNGVKGGQWPDDADEANSYIDPYGNAQQSVFEYDMDNGEIKVRADVAGVMRANATQTIKDLALNYHRDHAKSIAQNATARRVDLAVLRQMWVENFNQLLSRLASIMPDLSPAVVAGMVSHNGRFSSICRQFVERSEYQRYLV